MSEFNGGMDTNLQRNSRKEAKPSSKKVVFILLALAVVIVLAIGGYLYVRYTDGVAAYENADYETAINILETVPFGKSVYVKASCKLAEQELSKDKYKRAYNILDAVHSANITSEIRKASEECALSGDFDTALICVSLLSSQAREEQLAKLAQMMLEQGNQEQADIFLGKNGVEPGMMYSYCQGLDRLDTAVFFDADDYWLSKATPYFRNSGDYLKAQEFADFIDFVCNDQINEAIDLVIETAKDKDSAYFISWVLQIMDYQTEGADLAHYLPMQYLFQSLKVAKAYDPSDFEDLLGSKRGAATVGADDEPGKGEIRVASLESVYELCGSEPAGKILIVNQYPLFINKYMNDEKKSVFAVSFELMQYLPIEYYPKSLDEVSYVIVLSYENWECGEYDNGTSALQEYGMVYACSLETNEDIYESNYVFGPEPPNTYTITGTRSPKFISGGRPKLYTQFIEGLEAVMNHK